VRAGIIIADGSAVWILDDTRESARTGDIILSPVMRDGFLLANGQKVKASKYPRLLSLVLRHKLSVSPEEYKNNHAKYVYVPEEDSLTVPDAMGRVLQGGGRLKELAAGLPNITGEYITRNPAGAYKGAVSYTPQNSLYTFDWPNCQYGSGIWKFDASSSNPIYGASDTVQPPAIEMFPLIKF